MTQPAIAPRSALFVPAHKPSALAKATTLGADMIIVELEDAVPAADKDVARDAAHDLLTKLPDAPGDVPPPIWAMRVNGAGTPWHDADVAIAHHSAAAVIVVPKVESVEAARRVIAALNKPIIAMIESPRAVLDAAHIAAVPGVAGLMVGSNDLAHDLKLPGGNTDRAAMAVAFQMIVLAARAAGIFALDAVYNRLDDADGFAADVAAGRALGYDGKALIHPSQVAPCNALYAPSAADIAAARAIIAAAGDGATRVGDRMIEGMHIIAARALLVRAGAA